MIFAKFISLQIKNLSDTAIPMCFIYSENYIFLLKKKKHPNYLLLVWILTYLYAICISLNFIDKKIEKGLYIYVVDTYIHFKVYLIFVFIYFPKNATYHPYQSKLMVDLFLRNLFKF